MNLRPGSFRLIQTLALSGAPLDLSRLLTGLFGQLENDMKIEEEIDDMYLDAINAKLSMLDNKMDATRKFLAYYVNF